MAKTVELKNSDGDVKVVKVGSSWTCFFFGNFLGIPWFMRGLHKYGCIGLFFSITAIVFNKTPIGRLVSIFAFFFAFFSLFRGNDITVKHYLKNGYDFAYPDSHEAALAKGKYFFSSFSPEFSISDVLQKSGQMYYSRYFFVLYLLAFLVLAAARISNPLWVNPTVFEFSPFQRASLIFLGNDSTGTVLITILWVLACAAATLCVLKILQGGRSFAELTNCFIKRLFHAICLSGMFSLIMALAWFLWGICKTGVRYQFYWYHALFLKSWILACLLPFCLALSVCVAEGSGFAESLKRSRCLTEGNYLKLFIFLFVVWTIEVFAVWGFESLIRLTIRYSGPAGRNLLFAFSSVEAKIFFSVLEAFHLAFVLAVHAVTYWSLRVNKEGVPAEKLEMDNAGGYAINASVPGFFVGAFLPLLLPFLAIAPLKFLGK